MRLILTLCAALFGSVAFAADEPDLIGYEDFANLSDAYQSRYLTAVAKALAEYERGTAEVFAADEFASYPYFREQFGRALENLVPRAHAAEPEDPCEGLTFEAPISGSLCAKKGGVKTCTSRKSFLGVGTRDVTQQNKLVDSLARTCVKELKRDKRFVEAYERFAKANGVDEPLPDVKTGESTPPAAATTNAADAKPATDAKPAAVGTPATETARGITTKPMPAAKGDAVTCGKVESNSTNRAQYRKDGACLIGGRISSYPPSTDKTSGSVRCKVVQDDGPKRTSICTDANTFGKSKTGGKISRWRRTACQSQLFCRKDQSAFCVDAGADVLGNCEKQVNADGKMFASGAACRKADKDGSAYRAFRDQIGVLCHKDYLAVNGLLCKDCERLVAKLNDAATAVAAGPKAPTRSEVNSPLGGGAQDTSR